MKTIPCVAAALLAALLILPARAAQDPAPKKPDAKKPVYDEKADAKAQIETALAAARRENRRVLIQWGANWCGWCVLLHDRFKTDPGLRKTLLYEYVVVAVDVGKFDKNLDLASKYGADLKKNGIPYLTVLDPAGKALANQATEPFETKSEDGKKGHDPKKVQEFLAAHQAKPLQAADVLNAALEEAAKSDRGVFLHFGAPWCGWCLKLEAWMARPEIAKIMEKDFVEVKIDQDRMTGAKEVFARYNAKGNSGIPWFVMLDAKGKAVVTSDGPKGNIGFPYVDHEIVHFVKMLQAAKRRITDDEIEELRRSLIPPPKTASSAR